MKHLLIILSILILSFPLFGQSSKPLGLVLPPTVMGNVSNSRKQILLNTLDEEVSKYFNVSPSIKTASSELPVVEDVFQLQIIEEDGDTQLSLRWTTGNERKVETIICEGCKTNELNGKLGELVGKLVRVKTIEPVVIVRKKSGWTYLATSSSENKFYYDKDRVRKSGKNLYFWELSDFIKPISGGYLSTIVYTELDCSIFRVKTLKYKFYDESMGKGEMTNSNDPDKEWRYPPQESVAEFIYNKICKEHQ